MGDGILIEFQSTVDAVKCAVDWQQNISGQVQTVSIAFRIGSNPGDIFVDGMTFSATA
jgi:adenylate cyclase